MSAIFLSASVPSIGRGRYAATADPYLIQCAVRELVVSAVRTHKIVWGGHPAITPMILEVCRDLGNKIMDSVILYQSNYFRGQFPEENKHLKNVVVVDAVNGDRGASLAEMRRKMLSRLDLVAAVFVGGMEGVELEKQIFSQFHPSAPVVPVPATGGAALELARRMGIHAPHGYRDIDFARLFRAMLSSLPPEQNVRPPRRRNRRS